MKTLTAWEKATGWRQSTDFNRCFQRTSCIFSDEELGCSACGYIYVRGSAVRKCSFFRPEGYRPKERKIRAKVREVRTSGAVAWLPKEEVR